MSWSKTLALAATLLVSASDCEAFVPAASCGGAGGLKARSVACVRSAPLRVPALRMSFDGEFGEPTEQSNEPILDKIEKIQKSVQQAEEMVKEVANFPERMSSEKEVLRMAAMTNRGQGASLYEKESMERAIQRLLDMQAPIDVTLLNGEWRLIYATEAVTRSSPFFWAFRKSTSGINQPIPLLPEALSEALFAITDGIPFASIGSATQTITGFGENVGTLVSSVQVSLRVFDALLPPNVGYVTTTSTLSDMGTGDGSLRLTVQTTEVKDSTWGEVPVLGQAFEGTKFPSGDTLERVKAGSSSVDMKVEYISDTIRVTRADDGQLFVHARV